VGSYVFDLPGRLSRRRRRIDQAVFRAAKLFEEAISLGTAVSSTPTYGRTTT